MANQICQLISGDGVFIKDVERNLMNWGFHDSKTRYHVVSILGAQSSGKSTMLNLVFGTNFAVMNDQMGRNQTTRGIWLGQCDGGAEPSAPIMVLDVEGTDGRERGEDEKTFERQTSLFSLALAQLLVVNMWTHDVGRYEAANFGLLKTVFEQNLRLFGRNRRKSRTVLMFLLRDFTGKNPLEKLSDQLTKELEKIWAGLAVPPELGDVALADFFSLQFVGMPHKEFQPDEFHKQAQKLSSQFCDSSSDGYLFAHCAEEDVPADGWSVYAENIWETIVQNKDLDLPTQKVFLATMRCDELSAKGLRDFDEAVRPVRASLSRAATQYSQDFAGVVSGAAARVLADFDAVSARYFRDVVQQKRAQLFSRIVSEAHPLFLHQVSKVCLAAATMFDAELKAVFEGFNEDAAEGDYFGAGAGGARERVVQFFRNALEPCVLAGSDWTLTEPLAELEAMLDERLERAKVEQIESLRKVLEKKIGRQLLAPVRELVEDSGDDMWPKIREVYVRESGDAERRLRATLGAFGATAAEVDAQAGELQQSMTHQVVQIVKQSTDAVQSVLRSRFDAAFSVDADGKPREWDRVADVNEVYEQAVARALAALAQIAVVRLDAALDGRAPLDADWDDGDVQPAERLLLPRAAYAAARDRFQGDARVALANALAEKKRISNPQSFSLLSLLLIAALGFNELMMVLYNRSSSCLSCFLGRCCTFCGRWACCGPWSTV